MSYSTPHAHASESRVLERSGRLVLRVTLADSKIDWPQTLIDTLTAWCPQTSVLAESVIVIATASEVRDMPAKTKQALVCSIESDPDAWIPLAFTTGRPPLAGVSIWHPAIDAARHLAGLPQRALHLPLVNLAPSAAATFPDIPSLPQWPASLATLVSSRAAHLATYAAPKERRAVALHALLPRLQTLLLPATSPAHLPESCMDALAAVEFAAGNFAACIATCNQMDLAHVKAHVRAGDAWFKLGVYPSAVRRYACALVLAGQNDDEEGERERVAQYVVKMLARVLIDRRSGIDPFECVDQDDERELSMLGSVCARVGQAVARERIARAVREVVMAADWVEPVALPPTRAVLKLPTLDAPASGISHVLPPQFAWLVPHVVAGSSSPRTLRDMEALSALGVRLVVSATPSALPASWFAHVGHGIQQIHLTVPDNQPPTLAQLDCFVRLVTHIAPHGRILVHCSTGLGPTATFLAAYLVRFGLAAPPPLCGKCANSIGVSRELERIAQDFNADRVEDDTCDDPACALRTFPTLPAPSATSHMLDLRSDATVSESTIRDFSARLLARLATPTTQEPWDANLPTVPTHVGGPCRFSVANLPRIILLVGLPGSGKSHLARTLQAQLPNTSIVASDDTRSTPGSTFHTAIANLARDPRARLILDACHATASTRQASLAAAFDPPARDVLAVHVDVPMSVCVERARARVGHPTLDPARAPRVIAGFARQMQVPTFAVPVNHRTRTRHSAQPGRDDNHHHHHQQQQHQQVEDPECKRYGAWIRVQSPAQAQALVRQLTGADALMVKFPRTPHLYAGVASIADDDEVVPDLGTFAAVEEVPEAPPDVRWTVEEKVDGANVGIHAVANVPRSALYSMNAANQVCQEQTPLLDVYGMDQAVTLLVQNRSHFVVSSDSSTSGSASAAASGALHPQFAGVPSWLDKHKVTLTHLLLPASPSASAPAPAPDTAAATGTRYVLFGEWTAAKHSVHYPALPDTFLAFDLFDTCQGQFVSRHRFRSLLTRAHAHMRVSMDAAGLPYEPEILAVKQVWSGAQWPALRLGTRELADAWVRTMGSAYGAEVPEGIVVRKDAGEWLVQRGKYVRGDFIAGDQHWTKFGFVANGVVRNRE